MGKRDELTAKYAADLKEKCGITADPELLTKVVRACGPSIYQDDASTVSASDPTELERLRRNFLMNKLGLAESRELDGGIQHVIDLYGRANRNKYRAVFYYLLVKHFRREHALN